MARRASTLAPGHILPQELVIKSADSHLYRIGLCVPTDDRSVKRYLIHKPMFILAMLLIETCKTIAFSVIPKTENDCFRTYFGDYGAMTGMDNFYRFLIWSYMSTTFCSMVVHYLNHKKGKGTTYLNVFKMMAGLVTPESIGLTDKGHIVQLIKRSRSVFKLIKFNNGICLPLTAFLFGFGGYVRVHLNSVHTLVIYGIPNSLFLTLLVYIMYDILLYQLIYFYIICVFLKFKLKSNNENLKQKNSKTSIAYIVSQLKVLNSLYKEINEYNTEFWSLYFLLFWLNNGSVISIELYIIFVSDFGFIFKFATFYSMITFFLLFLFMVFTASSINYEAKKTYKILNHLFVSKFVQKRLRKRRQSIKYRLYSFRHLTWIIKVIFTANLILFKIF